MRIVACLSWYDEPPEFLDRCVRSLAGIADTLIAVDGPWQGFPYSEPANALAMHTAIIEAAEAASVEMLMPFGWQQWQSQVAKRDAMMREGSRHADWMLVIDADEWIVETNARATRAALEQTDLDVATVICHNISGTPADRYSAPIRRLYRPPITVETAHNGYRTADGRWLHGDPSYVKLEPARDTPLVLHHQPRSRSPERNQAALDYRAARRAHRTEQWLRNA